MALRTVYPDGELGTLSESPLEASLAAQALKRGEINCLSDYPTCDYVSKVSAGRSVFGEKLPGYDFFQFTDLSSALKIQGIKELEIKDRLGKRP